MDCEGRAVERKSRIENVIRREMQRLNSRIFRHSILWCISVSRYSHCHVWHFHFLSRYGKCQGHKKCLKLKLTRRLQRDRLITTRTDSYGNFFSRIPKLTFAYFRIYMRRTVCCRKTLKFLPFWNPISRILDRRKFSLPFLHNFEYTLVLREFVRSWNMTVNFFFWSHRPSDEDVRNIEKELNTHFHYLEVNESDYE